ncbi:hypothetical protein K501DRAFT_267979 [Backusella circina FSU 941]|nr:hypothetical protein K501DRAFT_267979 [Backusella circina FSU 941]
MRLAKDPSCSSYCRVMRSFSYRSVKLARAEVNQLSDLRLLYLGTEKHNAIVGSFCIKKPTEINPIVFDWCFNKILTIDALSPPLKEFTAYMLNIYQRELIQKRFGARHKIASNDYQLDKA